MPVTQPQPNLHSGLCRMLIFAEICRFQWRCAHGQRCPVWSTRDWPTWRLELQAFLIWEPSLLLAAANPQPTQWQRHARQMTGEKFSTVWKIFTSTFHKTLLDSLGQTRMGWLSAWRHPACCTATDCRECCFRWSSYFCKGIGGMSPYPHEWRRGVFPCLLEKAFFCHLWVC